MKKLSVIILACALMLAVMQSGCTKKSRLIPTAPACAPDIYEQDDTYATAKDLPVNAAPQLRNSHDACDIDYARIYMAAGGFYTITAAPVTSCDTEMYLYAPDGVSQLAYDDDSGPGLGSSITFTASASGYYFVKISQKSCSQKFGAGTEYTLYATGPAGVTPVGTPVGTPQGTPTATPTCSMTPTPDAAGDAYEDDDSAATARLVTASGAGTVETHNSHDACDYDWYKFSAQQGIEYTVRTSIMGSNSAVEIYLYDTDAVTQLAYKYSAYRGNGTVLTWVAPADGVYYVKINQYSCATYYGANTEYTVSFSGSLSAVTPSVTPTYAGPPSAPDAYEDDDTMPVARLVVAGGAAEQHNSHDACDYDWYMFNAVKYTRYTIRTSIMGSRSQVTTDLYDASGTTVIATAASYNPGTGTALGWTAPADGTYYIKIYQKNCAAVYGDNTEYTFNLEGVAQTPTLTYTIQPTRTATVLFTPTITMTYHNSVPDAFEPDDTPAAARLINPGSPAEAHNSHDTCDYDWYKINAVKNMQYTVSTAIMGSSSAVTINIYGTDAVTQLASVSSYTRGTGTTLAWIAPASGVYYVRVSQYDCANYYGDNTEYSISFSVSAAAMTPTTTPTNTAAPDAYEDDDSAAKAKDLIAGAAGQLHNSHDNCDNDWVKFSAVKNIQYNLTALATGSKTAMCINIYGTDGYTLLVSQCNNTSGTDTAVLWTAPADGVYFARLNQYYCGYYGFGTEYTLSLAASLVTMTPTDTFTGTITGTQTPVPTVTDTPYPPDAYEDDDSAAKARLITVGSPGETHTSHDQNDLDWFKFAAVKNVQYTIMTTAMGSNSAVAVYLYNTDGYSYLNYAASYTKGTGTTLAWVAPADGIYYVRISQSSGGYGANTEYTVSFLGTAGTVTPAITNTFTSSYTPTPWSTATPTITFTPYPPDAYEDDDSAAKARLVIVGGAPETHNSHDACDKDWFKFNAVKSIQYTIATTAMGSRSGVEIYIYDTDGYTQLAFNYSYAGSGTVLNWTAPSSGVYYVEIYQTNCDTYFGANTEYTVSFTGSAITMTPTNTYTCTFTSTLTPQPTSTAAPDAYEDDDTPAKARLVTMGGQGEAHNSHDACDYDWYKFSALQNVKYTIRTGIMGSRSAADIYIYGTDGVTQLAYKSGYSQGTGTTLDWVAPADGIYYVRISQNNCWYYYGSNTEYTVFFEATAYTMTPTLTFTETYTPTLTLVPTSTVTPDIYEDDDSAAKARMVIVGGPAEAHNSHDACDNDWYKFSALQKTEYTISTSAMGSNSAVYIYIYGTDGYTQLAYKYSSQRGVGTSLAWTAPADGVYYVKICQYNCAAYYGANTEYTVSFSGSGVTMTETSTFTQTLTMTPWPTWPFTATPTITYTPYPADAFEDDDSAAKARMISAGAAAEQHNSHDSCDYDWFKFSAVKSIQYSIKTILMGSASATDIRVYDTDGYTQLGSVSSPALGAGATLLWTAPATGVYYVKINQSNCYYNYGANTEYSMYITASVITMTPTNTPTYTRTATGTFTPVNTVTPDAYENDDTVVKARLVTVGGPPEAHNSHVYCDYDWFKFNAVKNIQYTISTSAMGSNSAVDIYVFGTDGYTQLASAASTVRGVPTALAWTAPADGVYFFRINQDACYSSYGANTEYTMSLTASAVTMTPTGTFTSTVPSVTYTPTWTPTCTFTPYPSDMYEDDDAAVNARMITVGGAPETHNSHDSCDYDWYKFSALKGRPYTISTYAMGSNSAVCIYIYGTDGTTYLAGGCGSIKGNGTVINWVAPDNGIYYAEIYQYNCWNTYGANTEYTVAFSFIDSTVTPTFTWTLTYTPTLTATPAMTYPPDAYEDDSTLFKARLVTTGTTEAHNSHASCDYDWFKINAVKGIRYTASTGIMGSNSAVDIYVYDSDGYTLLASGYGYTRGYGTSVSWTAPADGICYIKIFQDNCAYYYGANTEYTVSFTGTAITMTPTSTYTFSSTPTNTYTQTLTPTPCPPDAYEPDDTSAQARLITAGGPAETHNSHDYCDYDWFKFNATQNMAYTVQTTNMGSNSMVVIDIIGTNGMSYLAGACSYTMGVGTTITWTAPADGVYYIEVFQYDCSYYFGANTNYTISLTASAGTMTPTFTPTYTNTPTPTFTQAATAVPDLYEDDDSAAKARLVTVGGAGEPHNSHDSCDYDWYKFAGQAGIQYTISTSAMGSNSAVYITLYGTDGYTQLASNFSSTRGTGTTLTWVAPADGVYYVKIYQYNCTVYYGANTDYTVSFTGSVFTMTPTFTPTMTYTATPSFTPTLTMTPYPPDAYEDDDSAAKARLVAVNGVSEVHTSHDACDYDWFKFTATGGAQVTIKTTAMGSNSAVYIYLYGTDGYTQINYAYSFTRGVGTTISWIPAATGIYYAKIYQYSCSSYYGANTQYTVSFTSP